jgi:peptidoglycan/xylan/chitin deacetylase (PgdA/CDA1 family)
MVTIFFRYDDYSSLSHPAVDRGLIEIFGKHQLSCTFAVVPAVTSLYPWVQGDDQQELPLNAEKKSELRAAISGGSVDLALHGWRHLSNNIWGHPNPSEFRGLPVDEQARILQKGRDFLADATGVAPTLFVPPWNSYDENTLKALEMSGFRGISANRYSPGPEKTSQLAFAPMTTELDDMRAAVAAAHGSGEDAPVVGVMMHPYDFVESGDKRGALTLAQFEQELVWLKAQPNVRILPISALLDASHGMDRQRFLANRPSACERSYPPMVNTVASDLIYHNSSGALRAKLRRDGLFGAILIALMVVGAASGWFAEWVVSRFIPSLLIVIPFAVLAIMAFFAFRAVKARAIYARGAALMALLSGAFLGSVI